MYRIYVGDYVKSGLPTTWTLICRSKHKPIKEAKEIGRNLKYGLDLYIVYDNKLIARYYGGEKCPQQTRKPTQNLKSRLRSYAEKLFSSSQS